MGRCTRDGSRLAVRVEDLTDEEIEAISRATITEGRPYDLDDLEEDGTMRSGPAALTWYPS